MVHHPHRRRRRLGGGVQRGRDRRDPLPDPRRAPRRAGTVGGYLARLPKASALDDFSFRVHRFAFPLWTFTILAGAVWADYAWGRFWGWDPKETWSLVTWVVYAAYLHARVTAGWKGVRAAWLAILGVITFWFNFVGINLLTLRPALLRRHLSPSGRLSGCDTST